MSKPGFPINMVQNTSCTNWYKPYGGTISFGTDTLSNKTTRYEDKDGSNTPGWPNAIQTNPYLRSRFTWSQDKLTVSGTVDKGSGHFDEFGGEWGGVFGLGETPWTMASNPFNHGVEVGLVRSRLIAKLIDKIQSHRVNLGEILQTRAQTASMVASTANRIAGSVMALRRGNFAGAARYLTGADPRSRYKVRVSNSGRTTSSVGGISEQWLQLQYGWQPLLGDIYNSCETVRRAWNDNGDLFIATATASETPGYLAIPRGPYQGHGPSFVMESVQRQVRGNASVVYGVDSNLGSSLSQLGITNPASLAWELLPYSFVVDWFIPIGSFLERLDYSRGLVFKHGFISIKSTASIRQRLGKSFAQTGDGIGAIRASWGGGAGSGEAMVMTREALSSFPPVPPPRFKDPFSLTHMANALSLLDMAFRGAKSPHTR